jgi:hypothetical protein
MRLLSFVFVISFILNGTWALGSENEKHRPFSEMKGGCGSYAMPLQREFELWAKASKKVKSANAETPSILLPTENRVFLELIQQPKVRFITKPEKSFLEESKAYGGMVQFQVESDGLYRVSLGSRVWFDIVDPKSKHVLDSVRFEMQTQCDQIVKVIEFDLKANKTYILQISSSPKNVASVLITQAGKFAR